MLPLKYQMVTKTYLKPTYLPTYLPTYVTVVTVVTVVSLVTVVTVVKMKKKILMKKMVIKKYIYICNEKTHCVGEFFFGKINFVMKTKINGNFFVDKRNL